MRTFIYTGGELFPQGITDHPKGDDITISADSGYKNAQMLGVNIDFAVGDFDSGEKKDVPKTAEIIEVPREKDFTDTQLAVDIALEHGADTVFIIGGLGGRLDHTLSNLAILEKLYSIGIKGYITDGKNRVRYIRNTSELIPVSSFKYLSLIAADEKVKGVTADGCKYPLKNATVNRIHQFAVSNEILKNCALISVKKGGLYIIESRD